MTSEISDSPTEETLVIPVSSLRDMLMRAIDAENAATTGGQLGTANWWGGYVLALRHVLALEQFQK